MDDKNKIQVGDVLVMKKNHACKDTEKKMIVLRLGSDIKIKCAGCGHEMTVARIKLEKNIKSVIRQ